MKRKRKTSSGGKKEKNRKQPPRRNPFLFSKHDDASTGTTHNNTVQKDVLQQVLAFVNITEKRSNESDDRRLDETVNALLSYLGEECDSQSTSSLISQLDVASMLLPWATKHLLHLASAQNDSVESGDDGIQALYWQTIVACLETLVVPKQSGTGTDPGDGGSKSGEVASILTQSALNKLVPFAADIVLSKCDTTTNETRDTCAKCYSMFTDLYRPTLDLACTSLLISVNDNLAANTARAHVATSIVMPSKAHSQVIHSTLSLLRTLQRQGAANPKKTFLLLSSPPVLTALSRLYFATAENNDCDFGLKENQELIRELLWDGLFSPSNHIEGFYSMKLPPPVIPKDCTRADAEEPKEATSETAELQSKDFHCYQGNLIGVLQEMLCPKGEAGQSSESTIAAAQLAPLLLEGFTIQTDSWEKNRSLSSHRVKRLGGDEIAALQFRFWSNAIARPMVSCFMDSIADEATRERSVVPVILLQSLRNCLALLLKHDIYLPSYEDNENKHFLFLEWVAISVLKFAPDAKDADQGAEVEAMNEILRVLQIMTRLNHMLLHDRLSQVVTFSITCASRIANVEGSQTLRYVCELISTVVETYDKLRQLKHFFKALLTTVDGFRENCETTASKNPKAQQAPNGAHSLRLLNTVVREHEVANKVCLAIRHCPDGQIHSLFDSFNSWIAEETKRCNSHGADSQQHASQNETIFASHESLSVVVNLFVLVTRNVRVDKHTAPDVAHLCQESLNVSAAPLLNGRNGNNSHLSVMMKHGLVLCAWLIDLQTRCDFWLSRCEERGNGPAPLEGHVNSISSILHAAIDPTTEDLGSGISAAESSMYYPMLGELQLLACYQIQLLHSQIHERQPAETVDQNEGEERSALVSEARKMVDFAVRVACHSRSDHDEREDTRKLLGSRWTILAQTIATWAPYAEAKHIESFLKWLFFTFAAAEDGLALRKNVPLHVFPSGSLVAGDVFLQDRAIVLSLLRDTSFFEIDEIATYIRNTGFTCAAELVRAAVVGNDTARRKHGQKRALVFEGVNLCPPSSSSWTPLLPKDLARILNTMSEATFPGKGIVRLNELIRGLRIMMLLNGLPEPVSEMVSDNTFRLETSLKLDVWMRLLLFRCTSGHTELRTTMIQMMCAIRSAAAKELHCMPRKAVWTVLSDGDCLRNLITGLCRSTAVLLEDDTFEEECLKQRLLLATGKFVGALFFKCLAVYDDETEPALRFASSIEHLLTSSLTKGRSGISERVLVNVMRPVINRIVLVRKRKRYEMWNSELEENGSLNFHADDVIRRIAQSIFKSLWSHLVRDMETNILSVRETGDPILAEGVVLLGDIIRVIATDENVCGFDSKRLREITATVENVCEALVKFLLLDNETESARLFERAAIYFLACTLSGETDSIQLMSYPDFSKGMLKVVQNQFLSSGERPDQLLDAALSGIVNRMESDALRDFLKGLLQIPPTFHREAIACSVQLFTIVLLSVKGTDSRKEVSEVAREFLFLSLELLSPPTETGELPWKTSVDIATCSITALMGNKDYVTLRERDIARILASVSSTVGPARSGLHQSATDLDDEVYSLCCSLVASLLQRFPKQIYACAPSLTSVMHSLLMRVISDSCAEIERTSRAQQFARLCELLASHKDIFKKHVLGLILEFVRALRGDLDPSFKKALLPAIYHLLDMLTQFETKQLNALMDTTGKALFRSVFQSYQKLHIYKGQY